MCGICGIYKFNPCERVEDHLMERMASLLSHRGPDNEGFYYGDGFSLGHRRLSIIDLSPSANQPMVSTDGQSIIIYNGEAYNYKEIRKDLENIGYEFKTNSDTEVVLNGYREWGVDILRKINGFFALCIIELKKRTMFIARDRIGIKGLYYSILPDAVIFASEIPPLLVCPQVSKEIDCMALTEQVLYRFIQSPKTLIKGIKKVEPGQYLLFNGSNYESGFYWNFPLSKETCSIKEEEAVFEFGERFEESVSRRCIADVPVGVLLSGGIDSSAIISAMNKKGYSKIETFTAAFEGGGKFDERYYARSVSKAFKTTHREILIDEKTFVSSFDDVFSHLDDPAIDLAIIPLYFVCKLARQSVKVVLSGQGADEILGGYHIDRLLREIKLLKLSTSIPFMSRLIKAVLENRERHRYLNNIESFKNKKTCEYPKLMHWSLSPSPNRDQLFSLLKEPSMPDPDPLDFLYSSVDKSRPVLDHILYPLCRGWLPDNLLCHSDRMSMAHSIELRVPYLDYTLLEWVWSLPSKFKIRGKTTKYLLKAYGNNGSLEKITQRQKSGFPVPFSLWTRGKIYQHIRDILLSSEFLKSYFNRDGIESLLKSHKCGRDEGLKIWSLITLSYFGEKILR